MKIKVLFRDALINFPGFLFNYVTESKDKYKTEQIKLWEKKTVRFSKFFVLIYGLLISSALLGVGIWFITLPIALGSGVEITPITEQVFSKYVAILLISYVAGFVFFIRTKKVNHLC